MMDRYCAETPLTQVSEVAIYSFLLFFVGTSHIYYAKGLYLDLCVCLCVRLFVICILTPSRGNGSGNGQINYFITIVCSCLFN